MFDKDDSVICIECGMVIDDPDNDVTTVCGGSLHPSCLGAHMSHCESCARNDNLMTILEYGDLG